MMNSSEHYNKLEELFKRIEASKINKKAFIESYISTLGLFDTDFPYYRQLNNLILLAYRWAELHGIKDFDLARDLDKLPRLLRMKIIKVYTRAVNYRITTFDSSKKLFFSVDLYVPKKKLKEEIEELSLDEIVPRWATSTPTIIGVVSGFLGTGKTDFSLKIAELFLRKGYVKYIITNIKPIETHPDFRKFKGRYIEVSTLSELIVKLYELKDVPKIFILDEAAIHISNRRAMSKLNLIMNNLMRLFRKLKTHYIVTTQDFGSIDKAVREAANLLIYKETRDKAYVQELFELPAKEYYLVDIRGTTIPFDTTDVADFQIDIDTDTFSQALRIIAQDQGVDNLKNLLYASGAGGQITELKRELYETILKLGEFTYQDVMDILDINYKTLVDYVNKLTDRNILRKVRQGKNVFFELTEEGRRKLELILEKGSEHVLYSLENTEEVV